jgi:hypothetical protein
MEDFNGIGTDIITGGIFERFPLLKPYVGKSYESNQHSKLLLITESNYLNENDASITPFTDANAWYHEGDKPTMPEKLVSNAGKVVYLKGLFNSIKKLLNTTDYEGVAFYNYFLRPASNTADGKGFGKKGYYQEKDGKVAFAAFCGILDELKPDIVIFATKFGFDKMESFKNNRKEEFDAKYGGIVIKKVAHPSSRQWWKDGGKNTFEELLIEHWLKNLNYDKLKNIHNQLKQKLNVEQEPECFIWTTEKGVFYMSKLLFKVKNYTFCYQTEIAKDDLQYYTYFYTTDKNQFLKSILAQDKYGYKFLSTDKDEEIVKNIEKLIHQVIDELSK